MNDSYLFGKGISSFKDVLLLLDFGIRDNILILTHYILRSAQVER